MIPKQKKTVGKKSIRSKSVKSSKASKKAEVACFYPPSTERFYPEVAEDRHVEFFYSKTEPPELLFTLHPDGRVEASQEVDYRLWLEVTGINEAVGTEERVRMSKALLRLAEYHGRRNQKPEPEDPELGSLEVPPFVEPDPRELLDELADTIGSRVLNDSEGLRDLVGYAAAGVQRWKKGKKKTLGKPNVVLMIHRVVKAIILRERRLPSQNEVRQQLEADGWLLKGKTAWSDSFNKAGLDLLEKGGKYISIKTFKPVVADNI